MKIKDRPDYINITIPAYKEPDLLTTIRSLLQCDSSDIEFRIDVLINAPVDAPDDVHLLNKERYEELETFIEKENLSHILFVENRTFSGKHAGVGLARKTLMDAVSQRMREQGFNGLVTGLDADCTVDSNYLTAISNYFKNSRNEAACLNFEHPLENSENYKAIMEYEWHLRYFVDMQRFCAFPFAFQTVGSSMACRSESYLRKGGMNKRKAGEDFYFLQKFIKDNVCGEINSTTVYPDGRVSDRVPFGTGRAVGKYEDEQYLATTYNYKSFEVLKMWNIGIHLLYHKNDFEYGTSDQSLLEFLKSINYESKINEIRKHVSTEEMFLKRFYQFFDAFQLMKCLHFMRKSYPDLSITEAMEWFEMNQVKSPSNSLYESLMNLRKSAKKNSKYS